MSDSPIKLAVEEFCRIHAELIAQSRAMSMVRKQKTELGLEILKYLRQNDVDAIATSDVNLIMKDSKRTESMSKDLVADVLRKHGLDAEKILADIQSSRKTSVKQVISVKKR